MSDTEQVKKAAPRVPKNPRLARPVQAPQLRLRLRSKLVVAMAFAALVPVLLVAVLATRVILSSLERGLHEDADRQLTVGLNLVLRSVERIYDETVQLAESSELVSAMNEGPSSIEGWIAYQSVHVPSARLQLFDATGKQIFDRVLGGADARFADLAVSGTDVVAPAEAWTRTVSLVEVGDRAVVRAVSPIVDASLSLVGVLVLSTPLDGDFADGIKGALSADVLIGGTSGKLQATFRSKLGKRSTAIELTAADRQRALHGRRVIRDFDLDELTHGVAGQYELAITGLLDHSSQPVGMIAVAVDRTSLAATKRLALRSLIAGGAAALVFALVLAGFWSRRLGAPIRHLHYGAIAVSRGDLEHRIDIPGGDELTDLAEAFNQMTSTLKENQARLAARMREIVALHDAGRAVSSVIDLDSVSRKIVDAVARTFDIQLAALWLVEPPNDKLRLSAARARKPGVMSTLATDEAITDADALRPLVDQVFATREPVQLARGASDPKYGAAAQKANAPGPLVALPLDRNRAGGEARVVGVLAVGRAEGAKQFSEADLNLVTTFADQAGAAVENALLYQEVREASEELEKKVRLRTSELTAINHELGKAFADLRETQAQLILSERMAGLGLLVAGVAHEINSPTAAIRGSIDGLAAAVTRVARHGVELAVVAPTQVTAITSFLEQTAPRLAERPLVTGLAARKAAKELVGVLGGFPDPHALAAELADLGATLQDAEQLGTLSGHQDSVARKMVAALTDDVYLHRTSSTVRTAVQQIQRIVGALKTYSHLDQQATRVEADLHEGLETTLTLLHHAVRDIVVERHYGNLPRVPIFVDELNQVWTNLISNAQQALAGKGTIAIETDLVLGAGGAADQWAVVRVIDDGPGVPADVLPQIFDPFFTTKPKGEGTGLGLGIARQIVDKHGGTMTAESRPGRTVFEVRLPILVAIGPEHS
ncbi:MAG TPA: ATP-binding protein [Kofleriaceae bacterium]|jgi:signal transduction histidine kinase